MRKLISIILVIVSILTFTFSSFASGNGNVDSGGSGGSGSGTSQNKWREGDWGVRVSIVDNELKKVIRTPIDLSNKNRSDIQYHFGKISKLNYKQGFKLIPQTTYNSFIPKTPIPTVVSLKGNNINEIKRYFTSKGVVEAIANYSNIGYEELISGKYKLLLEPIIYITYHGKRWAMTAHEVAMYNEKTNGDIRRYFVSVSHRTLPFSMFLEVSDLGFPAYKGQTSKPVKDDIIKEQLGLGIVRFNGTLPDDPSNPTPPQTNPPNTDVDVQNYTYRTNTEVITSFNINTDIDIIPDRPIKATFDILGKNYVVDNIVIPSGSSQLVWVKWKTPSTPQTVNINVKLENANISNVNIRCEIGDIEERIPPDPTARDEKPYSWRLVNLPNPNNRLSSSWHKWSAKWEPNWVWVEYGEDENGNPIGEYVDRGYWQYTKTTYSASLSASMDLVPGLRTPTAIKHNNGEYEMKSGYGVNVKVNTDVDYNCSSNDITSAQNVSTTFSEFKYLNYNRLLEKTVDNADRSTFEFKNNKYSTFNDRTHYTPVWYPDNTNYIVNAQVIDIWTPSGMLQATVSDKLMIKGNLHQDRRIAILKW